MFISTNQNQASNPNSGSRPTTFSLGQIIYFYHAIRKGDIKAVEAGLALNIPLNIDISMHDALFANQPNALFAAVFSENITNRYRITGLLLMSSEMSEEIINAYNSYWISPLVYAAQICAYDVMRLILSHPKTKLNTGRLTLSIPIVNMVITNNTKGLIILLNDKHVSTNLEHTEITSLVDIAQQRGHEDIVCILNAAMAVPLIPTESFDIRIADKDTVNEWAESINIQYLHSTSKSNSYIDVENKLYINNVAVLDNEDHKKTMGVFSSHFIAKGTPLGEYLGKKISAKLNESLNLDYTLRVADDLVTSSSKSSETIAIDAREQRNWTAMVNSASSDSTANVIALEKNNRVYYHASANILPGQQLLYFYGDTYTIEPSSLRFLKPFDSELDSEEIVNAYYESYETLPKYLHDMDGLLDLLHIDRRTMFKIPHLVNRSLIIRAEERMISVGDLPLLALDTNTGKLLKQNQQENITALMMCCWVPSEDSEDMDRIRFFLENGVNPNAQTTISGVSALHLIVACDRPVEQKEQLIKLFRLHGAVLDLQDKNNESILHWAIRKNDLRLVGFLIHLETSTSLNEEPLMELVDNQNADFFLFALKQGVPEMVNLLITKINDKNLAYYLEHSTDYFFKEMHAYLDNMPNMNGQLSCLENQSTYISTISMFNNIWESFLKDKQTSKDLVEENLAQISCLNDQLMSINQDINPVLSRHYKHIGFYRALNPNQALTTHKRTLSEEQKNSCLQPSKK